MLPEIRDYHLADWACERVIETINEFENTLPNDCEAGIVITQFSNTPILIKDVRYWNPDILIFDGLHPDGSEVQIVQHVSQLNLCLKTVKRQNPEEPRRKIGFSAED